MKAKQPKMQTISYAYPAELMLGLVDQFKGIEWAEVIEDGGPSDEDGHSIVVRDAQWSI